MRGENGGLGLFLMAMKLSAQRFKLTSGLIDGVIEQSPLLVGCAAFFLHLDIHVAHLEDLANRQPRRCRCPLEQIRINILWPGSRGRDRSLCHRRKRSHGDAALITEAFHDHWGELVHRLTSVWSLRHEQYLVALRSLQSHQGGDTAGVRRTVAELKTDVAFEFFGKAAQHRRRPRMQAVRVRKDDGLGSYGRSCLFRDRSCGAIQCQSQHSSLANRRRARSVNGVRNALAVRDDQLGQQALRVGRDVIQIEFDERSARIHLVPNLYSWRESLPLQRNRIDAHVQQHFDVAGCLQCYRVTRSMLLNDLARTWRAQNVVCGIDRNSVAGKLLRENRVRHAFEGIDCAGDWRQEGKLAVTHGIRLAYRLRVHNSSQTFEQPPLKNSLARKKMSSQPYSDSVNSAPQSAWSSVAAHPRSPTKFL